MTAKRKYQPGDKVHNWTVIDYDSDVNRYRVMCSCGRLMKHDATTIRDYKGCRSCNNGVKSEDSLIGERFGCRVVIAELARAGKHRKFLVDCDCGREHELLLHHVLSARNKCRIKPDA